MYKRQPEQGEVDAHSVQQLAPHLTEVPVPLLAKERLGEVLDRSASRNQLMKALPNGRYSNFCVRDSLIRGDRPIQVMNSPLIQGGGDHHQPRNLPNLRSDHPSTLFNEDLPVKKI